MGGAACGAAGEEAEDGPRLGEFLCGSAGEEGDAAGDGVGDAVYGDALEDEWDKFFRVCSVAGCGGRGEGGGGD